MNSLTGQWGLYPWFGDATMVYEADIGKFSLLDPHGKVFYCVDQDESYITIKYREGLFKVIPDLFKIVSKPSFVINENVVVADSGQEGEVSDINWHFKNNEEFYYITCGGKQKSRRLYRGDLKKK